MGHTFYSELEPYAAQFLQNLIQAGHITHGQVEERSIKDLNAEDLDGVRRAHFFAGIGVWDLALQLAGWPADREVWTGSCPCQPFSVTGKKQGVSDSRHLWPDWFKLIEKRHPAAIFGEQVASSAGGGWLDLVLTDLEGAGYTVGAANLPACGVGAPHKRSRLFFCAFLPRGNADSHEGRQQQQRKTRVHGEGAPGNDANGCGSTLGGVDADSLFVEQGSQEHGRRDSRGDEAPRTGSRGSRGALHGGDPRRAGGGWDSGAVPRPEAEGGRQGREAGNLPHLFGAPGLTLHSDHSRLAGLEGHRRDGHHWRGSGWLDSKSVGSAAEAGSTRGFWGGCDWYYCRDGKYRPAGPLVSPMAHGAPTRMGPDGALETQPRVGRLKAYGNAIVPQLAAKFVKASMEAMNG